MYESTKHMIDEFGGYRKVADRMGMKATTLHSHMSAGIFPAKWFDAFCQLARELGEPEPSRAIFSFENLPIQPAIDRGAIGGAV